MKRYNPYKRLTQDELKYVVGGGPTGTISPPTLPTIPTGTVNLVVLPCAALGAEDHVPTAPPVVFQDECF